MVNKFIKTKKVIYFGDDENYWDSITERFKQDYFNVEFEFLTYQENQENHIQNKFREIVELEPVIIYFDFSSFSNDILVLIDLIVRDASLAHVPKSGFVEAKEDIRKHSTYGLDFLYVKGPEIHDVIYDSMFISLSDYVKTPQFATAKCEESVTLYSFVKIGFITSTYVHLEGNVPLIEGENVYLYNEIPESIVPSKVYTVKGVKDHDLHYPYAFNYDLEFHYVDQPGLEDEEEELSEVEEEGIDPTERMENLERERERRQELIDTFDHRLKQSRKKVKDWVYDNIDDSKEKKLKVLIHDSKMRVLREEGLRPIDEYPYSIRCFTKFSEQMIEIEKIRPGIIALQLLSEFEDDEDGHLASTLQRYKSEAGYAPPSAMEWEMSDDEKIYFEIAKKIPELETSDNELVENLISKIKSIGNYNPIIILFNSHFLSANALQQTYQYPMIMTNEQSISTTLIESMANMFETKQKTKYDALMEKKLQQLKAKDPKKYQRFSISDLKEKRYYISKKSDLSIARTGIPTMLVRINESEVRITNERIIEMGTYYLEEPFSMLITIVPLEKKRPYLKESGVYFYRGLIHGINEDDKKEIRKYVNDIFFAPLEKQRQKEQEDYEKLTELKIKEREEEEERLRLEALEIEEDDAEDDEEEEEEVVELEGEVETTVDETEEEVPTDEENSDESESTLDEAPEEDSEEDLDEAS